MHARPLRLSGWLLAAACFCATSCDSSGEFVIVQNQVPEPGCVIPGEEGNVYRGEGTLDVTLVDGDAASGYALFPLLKNNLPQPNAMGVQANRISLRAFRVLVEPAPDAPAGVKAWHAEVAATATGARLISYEEPWSGSVDANGGVTATAVNAFPAELARQLRTRGLLTAGGFARFRLRVRAVGETLDGELESDEFIYPLTVCEGCLARNLGACPATPVALGNECNVAQDGQVDCCTQGTRLVCPSVAAPTP